MAGFNLPVQAISPQMLAEMARAAFKPPALMSGGVGGGMGGGMQMPQSQGFNVGQGMAGMGQGLGMLAGSLNKPPSIDDRTRAIDAEIADWSKYGTPQQPQAGGGWFSNLFGGGRANGGEVVPGQYYTVGERGPETFVPAVPGTIVPNDPYSAVRPSEMPLYDPSSVLRPSEMPLYDPSSVLRPSERDFFGGRGRR